MNPSYNLLYQFWFVFISSINIYSHIETSINPIGNFFDSFTHGTNKDTDWKEADRFPMIPPRGKPGLESGHAQFSH